MLAFATLTGPFPRLGVLVVALLAAAVILTRGHGPRACAMLGALALAPALLLADVWHSPQLGVIRRHPPEAAIGAAVVLGLLAALVVLLARQPRLLGPLAMLALPFRLPISVGGNTSNLLVPLYFVIAAACLASLVRVIAAGRQATPGCRAGRPSPHRFEQILAGYLVLYAAQAIYSVDFEKALENMVFFYVPFVLLMSLLRDLEWNPKLLTRCLQVTAALAVVFTCIGFVEEATKTLLLNPKLVAGNNVHPYFTVNSVFFDPNIFGRYLALVMIVLVAVLLYDPGRSVQLTLTGVLAVLWGGLLVTLSRSSMVALLLGMATLAALRWRVKPVLIAGAVVLVLGAGTIAISPRTFGLNEGLNNASSGRTDLITGGIQLFGDRPVWGFGSGAFATEYEDQHPGSCSAVCDSHTIAITIAGEQGLIGLLAYLALVISALATLLSGAREGPARAAIAAAFLALVLHSELYAAFLEDPLTWTILGIGSALAALRSLRPDDLSGGDLPLVRVEPPGFGFQRVR